MQATPRGSNTSSRSARTIAELYRARWAVELFFKELKQTLQLQDFVGTNEKAVKWQVWTGLLTHLLLRFLRHISRWGRSFSRCAGIVRSARNCGPSARRGGGSAAAGASAARSRPAT
jgi:hypothetical protein